MNNKEIPLERGLCYAYEVIEDFERKQVPHEKQLAIAFEAGVEIGKCLTKIKIANVFKSEGVWA